MARDQIRDEAAAWVVRLSGAPTERDRAEFEAWRGADVQHDIAYMRQSMAWERMDQIRGLSFAEDWEALGGIPATPAPARFAPKARRWAAVAASVAALVGAGASGFVWLSASPAYATAVGERRTVALADGTTVELNTNSEIVVHYGRTRRQVELVRGEAMFHVVKDARPFVVKTKAVALNAHKANLAVRLDDGAAKVTVKDGEVSAEDAANPQIAPALIGPQSEAVIGPAGAKVQQVSEDEVDRVLAWRHGSIALTGETLAEAAEEFNRYNDKKIVVTDASAAALRVGGYFEAWDVDGFVSAMSKTFGLRASQDADGTVRLSQAG